MPENKEIHTYFDFPERLTVALFDKYERELGKNLEAVKAMGIKPEEMTSTRELAIVFQSALHAGLFLNWQSAIMPNPDTDNLDEQECSVILWAGEEMAHWLSENRKVPKVSWWRVLTMLWANWTRRRGISSKAGGQNAIRRYRDPVD